MTDNQRIIRFVVGPLETNCYLIVDEPTKKALIIDPGGDSHELEEYISANGLYVEGIVNTHGHHDHVLGDWHLAEKYSVPVFIHRDDRRRLDTGDDIGFVTFPNPKELYPDLVLDIRELLDNDQIPVGNGELKVIHTPGHTPGSICLQSGSMLITGDLLFKYGVGRTDLPGGSTRGLQSSLKKIFEIFPDDTQVFPGHGETTDLATERSGNLWLHASFD